MDAKKNKNIVLEAEKIINDHMLRMLLRAGEKNRSQREEEKHFEALTTEYSAQGISDKSVKPFTVNSGNVIKASYANKTKSEPVTVFLSVCLIISSILLGFVFRGILMP